MFGERLAGRTNIFVVISARPQAHAWRSSRPFIQDLDQEVNGNAVRIFGVIPSLRDRVPMSVELVVRALEHLDVGNHVVLVM